MENIAQDIITKTVKGETVKVYTTSEMFVLDYRDEHDGKYPQYDNSVENVEFRERYQKQCKSLYKKYVKDYAMTFANIYKLLDLHFKAAKRQDFAKCLAIEEIFTDINYHFEAGALMKGKYKDVEEFTKKEEEENNRYWDEQERLEKERQRQEDALVKVLKDEGFRVLLSAEGKRTMNFSYKTGLEFYLGSEICPVNFEAMQEYCDKFCVDDEVDRLRQYRSYREQCSIRGMLEEVEQYHAKVKGALCRARKIADDTIDNQ